MKNRKGDLRIFVAMACGVTLIALSGCATAGKKTSDESIETTLVVTRSNGKVNLSWESEKGYLYSVLYSDKLTGVPSWKPHSECQNIPGTGHTLTCTDTVSTDTHRYYRLHVTQAPGP